MGKDQESLGMPAVQTIHILTKKGEGGQIIWHLLCYIYILFEQKVFMYECHSSKMGIQNIYKTYTKMLPKKGPFTEVLTCLSCDNVYM